MDEEDEEEKLEEKLKKSSMSRSMSLPCFDTTSHRTVSTPTLTDDRWLSSSCQLLDESVPLLVLPSTASGERCCPFSAAIEMAMVESKLRYAVVCHVGGVCADGFSLPALRVARGNAAHRKVSEWVFGVKDIWERLTGRYPKHSLAMHPRLAHSPEFPFVSRNILGRLAPNSQERLDAEAARELLFRHLLSASEEKMVEVEKLDGGGTSSDRRVSRDRWIGERDERLSTEFRVRALWSSYNHVLSSDGGMGKMFLSGDVNPGILDCVVFCVLSMMRSIARIHTNQPSDNILLEGESGMVEWFESMEMRPSSSIVGMTESTSAVGLQWMRTEMDVKGNDEHAAVLSSLLRLSNQSLMETLAIDRHLVVEKKQAEQQQQQGRLMTMAPTLEAELRRQLEEQTARLKVMEEKAEEKKREQEEQFAAMMRKTTMMMEKMQMHESRTRMEEEKKNQAQRETEKTQTTTHEYRPPSMMAPTMPLVEGGAGEMKIDAARAQHEKMLRELQQQKEFQTTVVQRQQEENITRQKEAQRHQEVQEMKEFQAMVAQRQQQEQEKKEMMMMMRQQERMRQQEAQRQQEMQEMQEMQHMQHMQSMQQRQRRQTISSYGGGGGGSGGGSSRQITQMQRESMVPRRRVAAPRQKGRRRKMVAPIQKKNSVDDEGGGFCL